MKDGFSVFLQKNSALPTDRLKSIHENRHGQRFHVAEEDDLTILSGRDEIEQDGLLVAFDGFLLGTTRTPEEEIATLYREHGENIFNHLDGAFRTVIYDREKKRITAGTDPVGHQVLYYLNEDGVLGFSTHLTPLIGHPEVDAEVDRYAISHFLQNWSVSFGGGKRIVKGIRRLLPSHYLVADKENLSEHKYWEVYGSFDRMPDQKAVDILEDLLLEGVKRLSAANEGDTNVLFSGGLDSTLLASLLQEETYGPINTYTWGWEESHFQPARSMAEQIGTRHHELELTYNLPTDQEIFYYEEPQNAFLRYPFMELRSEHGITSCWTGLNSQAVCPVSLQNVRRLDKFRWTKPVLERIESRIPEKVAEKTLGYKISKALHILKSSSEAATISNDWGIRQDEAEELLSDNLSDTNKIENILESRWEIEPLTLSDNYNYLQLRSRDVARYAYYFKDMHHFDIYGYRPLVEFSYSLPVSQKKKRRLLRKIAEGRVPDHIITQGASGWDFVSEQFRRMFMDNRENYEDTVSSFMERGYVNPGKAQDVLNPSSYDSLSRGRINQMAAVYLLERWLKLFIDREAPWRTPG